MSHPALRARIAEHLQVLAGDIGARPPGSFPNRRAAAYIRGVLADTGMAVREHPFRTRWWEPGAGRLAGPHVDTPVTPNPFSRSCDVEGIALRVTSLAQLNTLACQPGRILVLADELTRHPLMPQAFPFANPREHQRVIDAVSVARPLAVITVSDGSEPILEDPDLPFASATVSEAIGSALRTGDLLRLWLGGRVHDGSGVTVTARTPGSGQRVVVSAHLDSKVTTPGAFDNAGGVAVLLALAEDRPEAVRPLELVAFNGEDHFDACGEQAWLAATDLDEVALNVNLDGVGLLGRDTSLASLACPAELEEQLERFVAGQPGWVRVAPWFESDHAIFAAQGIPAVAITSESARALIGTVAHGPYDTVDLVDVDVLAQIAVVVRDLLECLDREGPLCHHALT